MAAAAVVPLALSAGRMAMQALPMITALYGASEGAKEGGLLGALTGGGLGYLGGRVGKGAVGSLTRKASAAAPGLAAQTPGISSVLGITPIVAKTAARAAVPLAAAGLAAPLVGRLAGGAGGLVSNLGGTIGGALGAGGNQLIKTAQGDVIVNPSTGEAVPATPGLAGFIDYQNAIGPYQSNLGFQRDMYRLGREEMGKQLEMLEPVIERRSKREMERMMAAARYRTDLATQQGLTLQGQKGAQAMAQTGLAGGIQGLTQQYQYG